MTPGQTIQVERLALDKGKPFELDRVLLIGDGDKVTTGNPAIAGAMVVATWHSDGRSAKVTAFKYKAKTRYHRKLGHHQPYTKLTIDKILLPGEAVAEAKPKRARRVRKETTEEVKPDGA